MSAVGAAAILAETGDLAHAALAAALLRWLHVIVTQRVPWNEQIASGHNDQPVAA